MPSVANDEQLCKVVEVQRDRKVMSATFIMPRFVLILYRILHF